MVFDCKQPAELAGFYAELIGGAVRKEDPTWVVVVDPSGRRLAFQLSPEHEPPAFPDPHGSQQVHLDIRVDDPDEAERKVLELGATRVTGYDAENQFRVFRDPAGHTFCLVYGIQADPSGSGA
ncbi:VOC family protein [Kibdelosporangium persicum]|uniref:VOC family protein n=1 Tax=Kibdelosporangium persicum TaxID=2698649 RepID=UPI0028AF79B4|nr:VOC family protein [Kibdelosporangium persicum]